ncbi:MAG: hypothetical protein WA766_19315, partial [Candidatus Acidiferrales bacterium]
ISGVSNDFVSLEICRLSGIFNRVPDESRSGATRTTTNLVSYDPLFLYRLEVARDDCFLGVAVIFNRFGVPIRNGVCMTRDGGESEGVC